MTIEDLKGIVHSDPEILDGARVFVGTRVPLQNLVDALEGGESIEDFLEGFPIAFCFVRRCDVSPTLEYSIKPFQCFL
jgi:uncharacterized protein (DUF433 family)